MELQLKHKYSNLECSCVPALVNINQDGAVILDELTGPTPRDMRDYDVFLSPNKTWEDLTYAHAEGFLDPQQLKNWI